jgi:hypothetical protein
LECLFDQSTRQSRKGGTTLLDMDEKVMPSCWYPSKTKCKV